MSRLFTRPDYAEDQAFGHTILTWHALSRGFSLGSGFGAAIYLVRRLFRPSPGLSLLRSAGTGSLVGTGLVGLSLLGRMRGAEDIQWKDRSYRLLWNKGQREMDDFWMAGAALGGVATATGLGGRELRRAAMLAGWRGVLGGVGLGSLVGILGQSPWRNGIKGGFPEERLDVA